jgi:hypothetical protein
VIDAADHDAALAVIDAWNTSGQVPRSVFHVVSVHETTAPFTANVARTMVMPPTIAVFADGNEDIATGYLRAAGIPQANGSEFPNMKCGMTNCGPTTSNPDMLTDLRMTGYLDGCGEVILKGTTPSTRSATCEGKISYLGGHQYSTAVPVTSGSQSQGTRLFLNALFEARCVTGP